MNPLIFLGPKVMHICMYKVYVYKVHYFFTVLLLQKGSVKQSTSSDTASALKRRESNWGSPSLTRQASGTLSTTQKGEQNINTVIKTLLIFLCGLKAFLSSHSWRPLEDYIDQQFENYFRDESGLNRRNIQDNRVHCCLYFISPFGHGYTDLSELQ